MTINKNYFRARQSRNSIYQPAVAAQFSKIYRGESAFVYAKTYQHGIHRFAINYIKRIIRARKAKKLARKNRRINRLHR